MLVDISSDFTREKFGGYGAAFGGLTFEGFHAYWVVTGIAQLL